MCKVLDSSKPIQVDQNNADYGPGRICTLKQKISIEDAVQRVKERTGLEHVRLARARETGIELVFQIYIMQRVFTSIINIFCIKIRSIETLFYILDGFITTIALCAGAGTSVLKDVPADLYLTGEMLHHDVLDAVHKGISVILTNHSDSERGYLKVFASTLHDLLNKSVKVNVSECDADPLKTV